MDTTKLLASWANSKVGKGKEYSTNEALADLAGISEATVRRMRSGKPVMLDTLDKIASAHYMTTDRFLEMVRKLFEDPALNDALNYEIVSEFNELPDPDKEEVRAIMKLKLKNKARSRLRKIP